MNVWRITVVMQSEVSDDIHELLGLFAAVDDIV